jgi:hypothetical protein
MRSFARRRIPTFWIMLFALIGIAASVVLGRVVALEAAGAAFSLPG